MRTIMAIVDKYGGVVCELDRDGTGFYKVPAGYEFSVLLDEGDEFRVEAIEVEDQEV